MAAPQTPRALLIDLDGVLYVGDEAVAGAPAAVAWIEHAQVPHLFLTNTTSRPRQALVAKLARMGITVDQAHILTPPVAAAAWMKGRGMGRAALFVPDATRSEFVGVEAVEDRPDAVVVGDLGDGWSFAVLNQAFRLLMERPTPALIALGMTRYWQAPDGLRLDTAPFVAALAHASGVTPTVLGKPARPFFEAALGRLGAGAGQTLMVGDDLEADVGGAQQTGMRGILVRTGKYRGRDASAEVRPDAVLDSIAALPDWWRAQQTDAAAR